MKVFCAAFMHLKLGFVIFGQKDFGAKGAHKMLVKLAQVAALLPEICLQLLIIEKSENCLKNSTAT